MAYKLSSKKFVNYGKVSLIPHFHNSINSGVHISFCLWRWRSEAAGKQSIEQRTSRNREQTSKPPATRRPLRLSVLFATVSPVSVACRFDPTVSRLDCLGFHSVSHDVVRGDRQMLIIKQLEFGSPAPFWLIFANVVFTPYGEAVLSGFSLREHDGVVHVKIVDPRGLKRLRHGIERDHLFTTSRLFLDHALIGMTKKPAVQHFRDLAGDL